MSHTLDWQEGCQQLERVFEREHYHLLHNEVVPLQAVQQEKIHVLSCLQQAAKALEPQVAAALVSQIKQRQQRNRRLLQQAAQLVRARLALHCQSKVSVGYGAHGQIAVAAGQRSLLAGWV